MATHPAEVSLLGRIAAYTEILYRDPGSAAFLLLSDTYRQMGMTEEALEVARRGVAALPRFSPGYAMLGRLLAEAGDLHEAMEAFEKALELDDRNVPALKGLARVCFRREDREKSRILLQRAASLKPEDAAIRRMLSSLEKEGGGAAVPPAPAASAGAPIATPTIAEIYLRQGLPERALQVYRDLLRVDPDNGEVRRKLEELEEKIRMEEGRLRAEETPEPEAESASPAEPAAASSQARQMEALARWLESARRRRRNVQ